MDDDKNRYPEPEETWIERRYRRKHQQMISPVFSAEGWISGLLLIALMFALEWSDRLLWKLAFMGIYLGACALIYKVGASWRRERGLPQVWPYKDREK